MNPQELGKLAEHKHTSTYVEADPGTKAGVGYYLGLGPRPPDNSIKAWKLRLRLQEKL